MTREPDIAEALKGPRADAEEGAPQGAPEPSIPAGEPEAPVAPTAPVTPDRPEEAEIGPEEAEIGPEDEPGSEEAELSAKAEKADEYLELAQRTKADFENYRRRATREAAAAQERGIARLAKELLPAVDNLDRALEAAASTPPDGASQDNGAATLVSGIKLVHDDVIAGLARAGIERFSPEGEPFDPQMHEAIAQMPVEGAESGTVVEVYQRGYRLGEVVIRPARVVVAA